jgi:hypothetical protein
MTRLPLMLKEFTIQQLQLYAAPGEQCETGDHETDQHIVPCDTWFELLAH